jgi:predicted Zn-dependent peptidase
MRRMLRLAALGCAGALLLLAQDLKEFEKRVTEFTLANGLHFIVLERTDAPVVSFHTYVNAGAVDDPKGETGMAHMFEHMAFKGTDRIGTTNYPQERKALERVEQIYDQLDAERRKRDRADAKRIADLEAQLKKAIEHADSFVDQNAYPRIIEESGGVGLNASTGMDSTNYYYSLPSNRTELWFLLESERFAKPVFREFYKERDVVREERRMRTESDPQGRLIEMIYTTAFSAHPYRNPPVGWATDILNLRVESARLFFQTYYSPANMTIAIAGDVRPAEIRRLAEKYFGRLPARPAPPLLHTREPEQSGERRGRVMSPSQPLMAIAFKRPDQNHADDAALDVVASILSSGRTGILYRELVRDQRIALAAGAYPTFPGAKYDSLFLFFLVPALNHTVEENEKALYEILDRLKKEPVDTATLERVKTKVRASVIRQLDSNAGLASQLAWYHVNYGDWRKLFTAIDEINAVTAQDVQRVANQYFIEQARTVAYTVAPPAPSQGQGRSPSPPGAGAGPKPTAGGAK